MLRPDPILFRKRALQRAVLLTLLLLPALAPCDPGVSGNFTLSETVNTQKSLRKIWSNLLAGYQQARNSAKAFVTQMRLTASLANSMEQNLIAWETVAQRTEALLHADIWDENPIALVEKLEKNLFEKTDALLYDRIPSARQSSQDVNAARRAWVSALGWGDDPTPADPQKSLLGVLGLVSLSPSQRVQETRAKNAFDVRSTDLAKTGGRNDALLFMSDNTDAHLSAMDGSVGAMDASNAQTVSDLNAQLSENDFVEGGMETSSDMDKLEVYSQILLSKASEYNRMGLASTIAIEGLSALSDALSNALQQGQK